MDRIRQHLTFANVASAIALFVALGGGTAVALTGSNTVFSDDVVDNQVYSVDVRNDTLSGGGLAAADLRAGSVATSEVAANSLGAADLASSSVGTDEVTDDSLTGTDILNGSLGATEFGTIPAARANNSTNQTIAASTPTVISLDGEGFDTTNLHDTATNNSRLTAPMTGVYQINGRVHWDSGAAGLRQLRIEKNRGLPVAKTIAEAMDTASATDDLTQNVSTISHLSAGDYVELRVIQQNPTATAVDTLADLGFAPELSMAWIGS
jgi:hypothetical protein